MPVLADASSSLTYLHHRYYDDELNRFTSPDPLAQLNSVAGNDYAYANNNPATLSDRQGLAAGVELFYAVSDYEGLYRVIEELVSVRSRLDADVLWLSAVCADQIGCVSKLMREQSENYRALAANSEPPYNFSKMAIDLRASQRELTQAVRAFDMDAALAPSSREARLWHSARAAGGIRPVSYKALTAPPAQVTITDMDEALKGLDGLSPSDPKPPPHGGGPGGSKLGGGNNPSGPRGGFPPGGRRPPGKIPVAQGPNPLAAVGTGHAQNSKAVSGNNRLTRDRMFKFGAGAVGAGLAVGMFAELVNAGSVSAAGMPTTVSSDQEVSDFLVGIGATGSSLPPPTPTSQSASNVSNVYVKRW